MFILKSIGKSSCHSLLRQASLAKVHRILPRDVVAEEMEFEHSSYYVDPVDPELAIAIRNPTNAWNSRF